MTRTLQHGAATVALLSLVACSVPPTTPGAMPTRSPFGAAPRSGPSDETQDDICRTAKALLVGASVDVVLTTGVRFTARVVEIRAESIVVLPKTRVPEPARTLALTDVRSLEPSPSKLSKLGAFGLGVLAGAGGFVAVIVILMGHS